MKSFSAIDINAKKNKIIEEDKDITKKLKNTSQILFKNSNKLKQLQKKVFCLQLLNKQSQKQSFRYQRSLQKLQSSQTFAASLLQLKFKHFMNNQKNQDAKHKKCNSQRQQLSSNKQVALNFFQKQHQKRIQLGKQEQERIQNLGRRKSYQLQNMKRNIKQQIKTHQIRLKQKRKRWNEYKLQQASFNYHSKVQQQYKSLQQNMKKLQELKKQYQPENQKNNIKKYNLYTQQEHNDEAISEMALNISNPVQNKSNLHSLSTAFMTKNNITINQPVQTHFSVQGVQIYSPDQIKSLIQKAQRVQKNKKQGQFVKPLIYKIDDQIIYQKINQPNQNKKPALRPKTAKKDKLQEAKIQQNIQKIVKKPIKASIKNELARKNQNSVKLSKLNKQKQRLQDKLQKLSGQYKQFFGNTLKNKQQNKLQINQDEQINENNNEQNNNEQQNDVQQQQGQQCLPKVQTTTLPKTKKQKNQNQIQSFSECSQQSKRSRLSMGNYKQRLGNAISSLFD